MINEAEMTELTQAEDMTYFRADLCCYSPESYSLEEKKEICAEVSHFFFLPEFFPLLVCHHDASPFINHGSKKQGTPLQPMDKFMDKGCSKGCLEGSVSAWRYFRKFYILPAEIPRSDG